MQEGATTFGEVVPNEAIQTVQHLEGGIVSNILVQEGMLVEEGQLLIQLDPAAAYAELEQMRAREAGLLLQAERLRAFAAERGADFSMVGNGYQSLVADQMTILETQRRSAATQQAVIEQQVQQRKAELASVSGQMGSAREQIALLLEELQMRETLFEKGLQSKVLYLSTKRAHAQANGELRRLEGRQREISRK